jgi:hypothetical protein
VPRAVGRGEKVLGQLAVGKFDGAVRNVGEDQGDDLEGDAALVGGRERSPPSTRTFIAGDVPSPAATVMVESPTRIRVSAGLSTVKVTVAE